MAQTYLSVKWSKVISPGRWAAVLHGVIPLQWACSVRKKGMEENLSLLNNLGPEKANITSVQIPSVSASNVAIPAAVRAEKWSR